MRTFFIPNFFSDDKYDQKVQRSIGISLTTYMAKVQNAPSVLEKAILPTLCYIGNAPKTSPLAEVNYDDILHCLIKFTRIRESTTAEVHKHLAYSILSRLAKTNDQSVRILTKILGYLDIPTDEPNVILELSQQVSRAQENVNDKVAQTSLKKFYNKLNGITNENDTVNTSASSKCNCFKKKTLNSYIKFQTLLLIEVLNYTRLQLPPLKIGIENAKIAILQQLRRQLVSLHCQTFLVYADKIYNT